jgi:hypothetical protein
MPAKAELAVILLLVFLATPLNVLAASPAPSNWGSDQYAAFVESLLEPSNQLVQQTLSTIAPMQDFSHFAQNLLGVFTAVSQLAYPQDTQDSNFLGTNWMSAPEIISYGRGDCKNHAILLATYIEALYQNTFGNLPQDLVWVQGGLVDPGHTGTPGGHVWVLLNMDDIRAVSSDAYNLIKGTPRSTGTWQLPVGSEPPWSSIATWVVSNLDSLEDRWSWWSLFPALSVIQDNHLYVELEATWRLSIGEFYQKKYPVVEVHDQWNSFEYRKNPDAHPLQAMGSLWLSSSVWQYGETVSWSAQGFTPNQPVSVKVEGAWGYVQFPDVIADSSGNAGFSFQVGTNILGSGQLVATDRTTNAFVFEDYSIIGQPQQSPPPASLRLSSDVWHYGDTVTWSAQGLTPNAVVHVTISGAWIFWDTNADATGNAGFSFVVGSNILGPGQLTVVDGSTNQAYTANYMIS